MATKPLPVDDDPVLAAIHHAPLVEATPEELAAFEQGLADIRSGRSVSAEQVRERHRRGQAHRTIADRLGMHRSTVQRRGGVVPCKGR